MRKVAVTGAGALAPVADSPVGLHAALCEGRSALKSIELFALDGLAPRPAGEIRPFEPRDYLGDRNLRPVDRTARLLLVAAQQALEGSGWTAAMRAAREVGLVLGTMFCSVRTIAEFDRRAVQLGPSYASPLDFANSVINAAAGQAAIWHDLRGINTTITGGEASSLLALAYAADLIRDGRAGALLAGGAEELCFESFLGHDRAGRLGRRPIPFDAQRDGFALAEGAAALLLEDAGVEPRDLDLLVVGANGSVRGDRAEALGLAQALGPRSAEIPVAAPKAQLGEALGASGAFQALTALGVFADGVVPGVTGLEKTEEGFPLGGVSAETRRLDRRPRIALLHAVSTDGQCCAVV